MEKIKRKGIYAAVFILALVLIVKYYISHISPGLYLYKSWANTADEIGDKLNLMSLNENSCIANVYKVENDKICRIASFSNNKKNKEISLMFYGENKEGELYIGANKIGLGVYGDTSQKYTVASERFRTVWNKSIYSSYLKLPQYIPDNLNYDTVSRNLGGSGLAVITLGVLGNISEVDLASLLTDVNLTHKGYMELYEAGNINRYKHYTLVISDTVSKKILKSVGCSDFGSMKLSEIDILCSKGRICLAETSVADGENVYNIRFKNKGNIQMFNITSLKGNNSYDILSFNCESESSAAYADVTYGNGNFKASCYVGDNNSQKLFTCSFSEGKNTVRYVVSLKDEETQNKTDFTGKDIYSASLSDLYHIYRHFPSFFSIK